MRRRFDISYPSHLSLLSQHAKVAKYKFNTTSASNQKQKYKKENTENSENTIISQKSKLKNTMTPKSLFFFSTLSLLILFIPISSQTQIPDPNPNQALSAAHTELTSFGFPIGLLPSSIHRYSINTTSGDFSVDLGGDCKVTLPPDNYLATYSKRVTGKIVSGQIAELDGIRVRAFFKWWSITGIRSNGEDLVFEVGMVTAKYPSKNFDESPACEGKHSAS